MDKSDFLKLAPQYYEVAVLAHMKSKWEHQSTAEIRAAFTNMDKGWLLQHTLDNLIKKSVIKVVDDPFGPTLYARATRELEKYVGELEKDETSPWQKSGLSGDRADWINTALRSVSRTCDELKLTAKDLIDPEEEWQPLPIERDNEAFLRAETAVSKTIEEVEKSNGYGAQHPEERESILGNLRLLQEKFKNAKEISIGYIKAHGIGPLTKLSRRFGDAAIGKLAGIAIDALLIWLGLK